MSVLGMQTEANKVYPACDPWERADNGAIATPHRPRARHRACGRAYEQSECASGVSGANGKATSKRKPKWSRSERGVSRASGTACDQRERADNGALATP